MSLPVAPANTLEAMLAKKQQLDDDLRMVEKQIMEGEESYIEETAQYGNIIKGWEGFMTSRTKPAGTTHHATKRIHVNPKDRIWSLSSATAPMEASEGHEGGDMDSSNMTGGSGGKMEGMASHTKVQNDRRSSHRQAKEQMDED